MNDAIAYNARQNYPLPDLTDAAPDTEAYAEAVADFQRAEDITVDGKMGPQTMAHWRTARYMRACTPYKDLDKQRLVFIVQPFEGDFDSMNRDGEYRGLFGDDHWAANTRHLGLSAGFIQFNQNAGSLGELLSRVPRETLKKYFSPHVDELLRVTNAPSTPVKSGRNPRVQPVGGRDLWETWWVKRFRRAFRDPILKRAQVDKAVDTYFDRALETCKKLGLETERMIVMVYDRTVQYGGSGAENLLRRHLDHDLPEPLQMYDFMQKMRDRRWGHRVEKIFWHRELTDVPCTW